MQVGKDIKLDTVDCQFESHLKNGFPSPEPTVNCVEFEFLKKSDEDGHVEWSSEWFRFITPLGASIGEALCNQRPAKSPFSTGEVRRSAKGRIAISDARLGCPGTYATTRVGGMRPSPALLRPTGAPNSNVAGGAVVQRGLERLGLGSRTTTRTRPGRADPGSGGAGEGGRRPRLFHFVQRPRLLRRFWSESGGPDRAGRAGRRPESRVAVTLTIRPGRRRRDPARTRRCPSHPRSRHPSLYPSRPRRLRIRPAGWNRPVAAAVARSGAAGKRPAPSLVTSLATLPRADRVRDRDSDPLRVLSRTTTLHIGRPRAAGGPEPAGPPARALPTPPPAHKNSPAAGPALSAVGAAAAAAGVGAAAVTAAAAHSTAVAPSPVCVCVCYPSPMRRAGFPLNRFDLLFLTSFVEPH